MGTRTLARCWSTRPPSVTTIRSIWSAVTWTLCRSEPDLPESGCNDDCRKIGHFCEEIRSLFEKFGQLEVDLAEEGVDLRLRCRSKSPRAKMIDVIAVRRGRGDSAGGGVWLDDEPL